MGIQSDLLSIYIHIPFCARMCSYCAFNTYTGIEYLIPEFVQALKQEIRYLAATNPGYDVGTVYLGGGTPSLLEPEHLDSIIMTLSQSFHIVKEAEITIECNPNDITVTKAQSIHNIGFNRISLGMQTADDNLLKIYKRDHKTEEITTATTILKRQGIDNISIDLIFGGPTETLASWEKTLKAAIENEPRHLSLYNLMLKGNTELTKQVNQGTLPQSDDDTEADMYELATAFLANHQYTQYEISNWSQEGYESQHNLQYWRNRPYLGIGPGAHGSAENIRTIVKKHPGKYIESFIQPSKAFLKFPTTPATSKAIKSTKEDEITNTIIMGMRLTREGISKREFFTRFGEQIEERFQSSIEKHTQLGLLENQEDCIRLTEKGRFLSNAVLRDFI